MFVRFRESFFWRVLLIVLCITLTGNGWSALAEDESETEISEFLKDPKMLMIVAAALTGVIVWSILHSVFIRPFVLVGVLRNYINSGMNDIPSEESFHLLDGKSKKFREAHAKI